MVIGYKYLYDIKSELYRFSLINYFVFLNCPLQYCCLLLLRIKGPLAVPNSPEK